MHCWTAKDAQPGLPRIVRAAVNVAKSVKLSICSWLLWGLRSRARLSLPNGFLCMSIPAVATRLSTTHLRPISLLHVPSLMSVMICWAIGRIIASSFDWMRGICLGSIFLQLGALLRWLNARYLLGINFFGLDRSCSAFWVSRPRVLIAQQLLIDCARYQRRWSTFSKWDFVEMEYPVRNSALLHSGPLPWFFAALISAWMWVFRRLWRSGRLAVACVSITWHLVTVRIC